MGKHRRPTAVQRFVRKVREVSKVSATTLRNRRPSKAAA